MTTSRVRAWIAFGMLSVTFAMLVGGVMLIWAVLDAGTPVDTAGAQVTAEFTLGASYAVVGWLIASRRSRNPLGWAYLGIGLSHVGVGFAGIAAYYGLAIAPESIPAADILAWLSILAWVPGYGLLLTFSLLLFPTGRLPSPRWRPVAWLAIAAMVLTGVPMAIAAWPFRGIGLIDGSLAPPDWANTLQGIGLLVLIVVAIASAASIVVRFRRSVGLERQQLKWFAAAVIPVIAILILAASGDYPPLVWILIALFVSPLLPIAIGIAVLRYRLYEIDRLISRTISYAAISAILVGTYPAIVLLLRGLLGDLVGSSAPIVAASTLVVAFFFQPLRRRVQRAVDRRFDRARYDAEQTAAAFSDRLRDATDMAIVTGNLTRTAAAALSPARSGIWIRSREIGH